MTKVISLSNEAYRQLKRKKGSVESFSEAILRLLGERKGGSLLEFRGAWVGDDLVPIEKAIRKEREAAGRRWSS
jgi:predicted CopG family antitoxin